MFVAHRVTIIGLSHPTDLWYNICMICIYKDCNREKIRARGLCTSHWNLEQYGLCKNNCGLPAANTRGLCSNCNNRGGKPPNSRNLGSKVNNDKVRLCSRCKNIFPLEEFKKSNHKNRCVKCQIRMKKHSSLIRKYKISIDQWEFLLESQGGRCAICDKASDKFCVDHDHSCCPSNRITCGKCIRGLLCNRCNNGMGLLNDNPDIILSAYKYLRNNKRIAT